MVKVIEDNFGTAVDPMTDTEVAVRRYTISNNNQMSVSVIQLGAIIQSVIVPDVNKKLDDVTLGFSDVAGYVATKHAYIGATLGRVANRVGNGEFILNKEKIQVTRNAHDKFQLHGGFIGFDSVIWEVHEVLADGVVFKHISPDGHEGYPGNVTTFIAYTLDEGNRFIMRVEATTDKTTCVNITNHAYFNLAGHGTGKETLCEHVAMIKSSHILETDDLQVPTGKLLPVENTVFDLRTPASLGERLKQFESRSIKGYDNCYAVNEDQNITEPKTALIAKIVHTVTKRYLEIHTNQRGVQFYTANNLPDEQKQGVVPMLGKNNLHYKMHDSFCLETENFPDAMNHENFPTVFLSPNEKYFHEVIYKFGIEPV